MTRKLEKQIASPMVPDIKGKAMAGMDGNEDLHFIFVDSDGNISNRNMVYNYSILSWEPMTQPLASGVAAHVVVDSGAVQSKDSLGALIDPAKDDTLLLLLAALPPLGKYELSDADDNDAVKYYGYLDTAGNWYIKQVNGATGAVRFLAGTSGYAAKWGTRASETYGYFDATF